MRWTQGLAHGEGIPKLESVGSATTHLSARCVTRSVREPDEPQDELEEDLRPPRSSFLERIRASAQVLKGHRLVPMQIHAEWIEYQQLLDDLLKRLSAQLARQARSEKARLRKLLEDQSSQLELEPSSRPHVVRGNGRKSELRRRFASQLGIRAPSNAVLELEPPPAPEEESP